MSDRSPEHNAPKPSDTHPETPLAEGKMQLSQKIQLKALEHPTVTRAAFIGGGLVAAATAAGLINHLREDSKSRTGIDGSDQLPTSETGEALGNSEIIFLGRNEDDELFESDVAQYLDVVNLKSVYDETNDSYFDPRVHEYQPGLEFKDPKNEVRIIPPNMVADKVGVVRIGIKTNNEYGGTDGIRMRLVDPEDPENPRYVWLAFVDKDSSSPTDPLYVDENGNPTDGKMMIISPIYMDTKPIKNNSQNS